MICLCRCVRQATMAAAKFSEREQVILFFLLVFLRLRPVLSDGCGFGKRKKVHRRGITCRLERRHSCHCDPYCRGGGGVGPTRQGVRPLEKATSISEGESIECENWKRCIGLDSLTVTVAVLGWRGKAKASVHRGGENNNMRKEEEEKKASSYGRLR